MNSAHVQDVQLEQRRLPMLAMVCDQGAPINTLQASLWAPWTERGCWKQPSEAGNPAWVPTIGGRDCYRTPSLRSPLLPSMLRGCQGETRVQFPLGISKAHCSLVPVSRGQELPGAPNPGLPWGMQLWGTTDWLHSPSPKGGNCWEATELAFLPHPWEQKLLSASRLALVLQSQNLPRQESSRCS